MKKFLMIGLVFAGQMHGTSINTSQTMWQHIQAVANKGKSKGVEFDEQKLKQIAGQVGAWEQSNLKRITAKLFMNEVNSQVRLLHDIDSVIMTRRITDKDSMAVLQKIDANVLKVAPTSHNKAMVNWNLDLIWLKNSFLFFAAGAGLLAGAHAAKSAGYSKDFVNPMSTLGATLGVFGLGSSLFSCRGKYSKFNYDNQYASVFVEEDKAVPAVPVTPTDPLFTPTNPHICFNAVKQMQQNEAIAAVELLQRQQAAISMNSAMEGGYSDHKNHV